MQASPVRTRYVNQDGLGYGPREPDEGSDSIGRARSDTLRATMFASTGFAFAVHAYQKVLVSRPQGWLIRRIPNGTSAFSRTRSNHVQGQVDAQLLCFGPDKFFDLCKHGGLTCGRGPTTLRRCRPARCLDPSTCFQAPRTATMGDDAGSYGTRMGNDRYARVLFACTWNTTDAAFAPPNVSTMSNLITRMLQR